MNHDDDLDPRDALASAHLDGLTTAEESARIAADPDLRARVAAMEAVRAALRAPVPTDEAFRERAISAALAAGAVVEPASTITELSAVAARRAAPSRALRIVGIAAALVLLAVTVPLLARMGSDRANDEAASVADSGAADEATEEAAEADDGAEGGGAAPSTQAQADAYSAGDESTATRRVAEVGALGDFDDADALAARVAELLGDKDLSGPQPATSSSPDRASTEGPCADEAEGASEAGASVILVGTAVLEGRAVQVTVVERADGRRTLTVADDAASCGAVLTVDLD